MFSKKREQKPNQSSQIGPAKMQTVYKPFAPQQKRTMFGKEPVKPNFVVAEEHQIDDAQTVIDPAQIQQVIDLPEQFMFKQIEPVQVYKKGFEYMSRTTIKDHFSLEQRKMIRLLKNKHPQLLKGLTKRRLQQYVSQVKKQVEQNAIKPKPVQKPRQTKQPKRKQQPVYIQRPLVSVQPPKSSFLGKLGTSTMNFLFKSQKKIQPFIPMKQQIKQLPVQEKKSSYTDKLFNFFNKQPQPMIIRQVHPRQSYLNKQRQFEQSFNFKRNDGRTMDLDVYNFIINHPISKNQYGIQPQLFEPEKVQYGTYPQPLHLNDYSMQTEQQLPKQIPIKAAPKNLKLQYLKKHNLTPLISTSEFTITANKKDNKLYIGQTIFTMVSHYHTHRFISLTTEQIPALLNSYQQASRHESPLNKVMIRVGKSNIACIRDFYRGKQYYSFRFFSFGPNGQMYPTRNGFNLTPVQMKKLIGSIKSHKF